jgi:hypothetical protein
MRLMTLFMGKTSLLARCCRCSWAASGSREGLNTQVGSTPWSKVHTLSQVAITSLPAMAAYAVSAPA